MKDQNNIISRLENIADNYKDGERELLYSDYEAICEAWSEIEFLRKQNTEMKHIVADIAYAVIDEGINPNFHRKQINYVKTNWTTLWKAINKAVEAVKK